MAPLDDLGWRNAIEMESLQASSKRRPRRWIRKRHLDGEIISLSLSLSLSVALHLNGASRKEDVPSWAVLDSDRRVGGNNGAERVAL